MQKHHDIWLSNIFDLNVFRIEVGEGDDLVLPNPCFAYAKIDIDHVKYTKYLTDRGFFIADTSVNFIYKKQCVDIKFNENITVRQAVCDDVNAIRQIASTSFNTTRFHADPYIDNSISNRIKSEWAVNYFTGKRGEEMLVAEMDGKVVGFNQILISDDIATIDLIAVANDSKGQGVGKLLIAALQKNYDVVRVGTQLSNKNSISLYNKMGFNFETAHYVLHYHAVK